VISHTIAHINVPSLQWFGC